MSPKIGTAAIRTNGHNGPVTTVGGAGGRSRPPGGGSTGRSWAIWFERALGSVFALVVVVDVAISVDYLRATVAATTALGTAAVALGTCTLVGSAVLVAAGSRAPWIAYTAVTVLLVAQLLVLTSVTAPAAMPPAWWSWHLTVPILVLAIGLLRTRPAYAVVVVVVVVYCFVRISANSGSVAGWRSAGSELSLSLVFVAMTAVFVPAWRRTAEIADDAARTRQRVFAATEATRATERQDHAASRLLHDEVIHAMRAVALPPGAIEPARVRQMAGHAADLLRGSVPTPAPAGGPADLVTALRDLADRAGIRVDLRSTGHAQLPDRVVTALVGAVGEALRNAELHSGGDLVTIEANLDQDGARIHIVDDGRGFDPATVRSGPMGYRQSIVGRLTEVGGSATVTSVVGAGTTVVLTWQVPEVPGLASHRLADLAGTRNAIVLAVTMPILGFTVVQAGLRSNLLADPRPALLAVAVMTALTITAARLVVRFPMTGRRSTVLVTAAILTSVAGGVALLPGDDVAVAYFAAGGGAPALALVAMFRPPWESVVGAVLATAVTIGMVLRLDPGGGYLLPGLPAIISNALGVACLLGGRLTIDRMASSIRRNEEMERHADAAGVQLRVAQDVLTARLGRVRAWALPFLTAVVEGRLTLGTPDTRNEASTLEAAVRDDIRLGAHIDDGTRRLIARARRAGRVVEIIADSDGPPDLPDGLIAGLLTTALTGDPAPDRTVLTVSGAAAHRVSLMVSPAPLGRRLAGSAERLGARLLTGPDFLLVRVHNAATGTTALSPQVGTSAPATARLGWAGEATVSTHG